MASFDKERFIEGCRAALAENDPRAAIRDLVARTVSEPSQVLRALGGPTHAGVDILYRARDLTILDLRCGPQMQIKPHDHRMWAVIGIYCGREQNTFFRRSHHGLTRYSSQELTATQTMLLDATIIHAVTNPLDQITAALHVYGGDLIAAPRSEWNPDTLEEQSYCVEDTLRALEGSRISRDFVP